MARSRETDLRIASFMALIILCAVFLGVLVRVRHEMTRRSEKTSSVSSPIATTTTALRASDATKPDSVPLIGELRNDDPSMRVTFASIVSGSAVLTPAMTIHGTTTADTQTVRWVLMDGSMATTSYGAIETRESASPSEKTFDIPLMFFATPTTTRGLLTLRTDVSRNTFLIPVVFDASVLSMDCTKQAFAFFPQERSGDDGMVHAYAVRRTVCGEGVDPWSLATLFVQGPTNKERQKGYRRTVDPSSSLPTFTRERDDVVVADLRRVTLSGSVVSEEMLREQIEKLLRVNGFAGASSTVRVLFPY